MGQVAGTVTARNQYATGQGGSQQLHVQSTSTTTTTYDQDIADIYRVWQVALINNQATFTKQHDLAHYDYRRGWEDANYQKRLDLAQGVSSSQANSTFSTQLNALALQKRKDEGEAPLVTKRGPRAGSCD